jgi:hypothetical protein
MIHVLLIVRLKQCIVITMKQSMTLAFCSVVTQVNIES